MFSRSVSLRLSLMLLLSLFMLFTACGQSTSTTTGSPPTPTPTVAPPAAPGPVTMAPRIDAVCVPADEGLAERDRNAATLRPHGRRAWKLTSGYSRRSLVETAAYRYKTNFGPGLSARREDSQRVQALGRCRALNEMTRLDMPDSYRLAHA